MSQKQIPQSILKTADAILHRLDYTPDELELCSLREAGSDAPVTAARRDELLAASRAGEVVKLQLDAIVFRQSKAERPLSKKDAKRHANANFVKFRDSDIGRLAKGFTGRPFLRDHDRGDLLKRGGTIASSELTETSKEFLIKQSLDLVKPWAVEAALDGTLQTFSIGWDPPSGGRRAVLEAIHCTVCKSSMFAGDCMHLPGDEHKVDGSNDTVIVEAEFRNPRAAEVSGVSFPAVQGTQIESVRAALSEARTINPPRKAPSMNEATLRALGLPSDATQEQVDAKIAALNATGTRQAQLETELRAAQLAATEKTVELARIEAEAKATLDLELSVRRKRISDEALAGGLWTPGDEREVLFNEFADVDLDRAERFVKTLSPTTPVGQGLIARATVVPSTFEQSAIGGVLTDLYQAPQLQVLAAEKTFRKMGITPEMFAKHGPHVTELRDVDDPWLDDGAGSLDAVWGVA